MNELLQKIESIDSLQSLLERLGTDLISHPDLNTEPAELKLAVAYTTLKQALRLQVEKPKPPQRKLWDLQTECPIVEAPNATSA